MAQSTDGVSWDIVDENIVENGDFDRLGQLYPVQNQDRDMLWYSGFDGTNFSIGLATREDTLWTNRGAVIQYQEADR